MDSSWHMCKYLLIPAEYTPVMDVAKPAEIAVYNSVQCYEFQTGN